MDRRAFVVRTALALAAPAVARAQPVSREVRIGFLFGGFAPPDRKPPDALRGAMADLGYVEGRNLTFTSRWSDAHRERMPALAQEIVAEHVDAIVAVNTFAAASAMRATTAVPIVGLFSGDPVSTGVVSSLGHPGGNVTGVTDHAVELSAKRPQILKETVPHATRVAVLWNAQDHAMTLRYQEIAQAAARLGVRVQPLGVREPDDFDQAFAAIDRERPDAMFLVTDALTQLNRKRVLDFANARRLPAMFEYPSLVREGGLMSYGANMDDLFRRIAGHLDRVLKGANPGDLQIEQPTRLSLVVNLRTAALLGIVLPPALVARADEVVR
jgi:putative ABC transport system substrate-binding protein